MQYVNVACENSLFENETSWLDCFLVQNCKTTWKGASLEVL